MRRAAFLKSHGGPEVLAVGELPVPEPGPGQVRVRMRAAALNHLDLFVRAGIPGVTLEFPHVPAADGAGEVESLGAGVTGMAVGDRVLVQPGLFCGDCSACRAGEQSLCATYGLVGEHSPGTMAELAVLPARNLYPVPAGLSWVEAAAFPLAYLTAWRMMVGRGALRAGETVLVHGIGGGVAIAALQIAKLAGAKVIVTSSSAEKLRRAAELGADAGIDYRSSDVAKEVWKLTGKRGVDLVVDSIGEATWMASLKSATRGGRIVTCGATSGPNPAEEIRLIFWKQLSILGSTMSNLREFEELLRAVGGGLRPVVDGVWPLERAAEAYARMEAGAQFGKVVVEIA